MEQPRLKEDAGTVVHDMIHAAIRRRDVWKWSLFTRSPLTIAMLVGKLGWTHQTLL